MKSAKKLLALLLTLCMVLSLLPTAVFAEEPEVVASGTCGESVSWTLDSTGLLVLSGTGATGNYEDSTSPLYRYETEISSVVVEDGITELGDYLFWCMTGLKEVTLPGTLTQIGNSTFYASGLTEINLPEGLKSIGRSAFSMSSLEAAILPSSLTTLGDFAFANCKQLASVFFAGNAPVFDTVDASQGYRGFLNTVTTIVVSEALSDSWEPYFFENFGGHLTWVLDAGDDDALLIPFTDLKEDAYYFEPVVWAYVNGITEGTTATTFSPNSTCTRAQMITFLWRALGNPQPVGNVRNPFQDVPEGSYYYEALLWAVQNGIVSGITPDTFGPNLPVTRAQVVAFLARLEGELETGDSCPFADVSSGSYYYQAVIWAWENGIAVGISDTAFAPGDKCTRGQIACFLYRYFADESSAD